MTRNVAFVDRAARILLGLGLLAIVFVGPRTTWGLVGIIPLVTGLFGFCPLYRLLGISTSRLGARPRGKATS